MENQEQQYIKGFNNGYLLAQYEPQLASLLTKDTNSPMEYFQGFASGKEQYDIDKTRHHGKDISRDNTPDKDKEDRDRDR